MSIVPVRYGRNPTSHIFWATCTLEQHESDYWLWMKKFGSENKCFESSGRKDNFLCSANMRRSIYPTDKMDNSCRSVRKDWDQNAVFLKYSQVVFRRPTTNFMTRCCLNLIYGVEAVNRSQASGFSRSVFCLFCSLEKSLDKRQLCTDHWVWLSGLRWRWSKEQTKDSEETKKTNRVDSTSRIENAEIKLIHKNILNIKMVYRCLLPVLP